MTHTIDTLLALADEYAAADCKEHYCLETGSAAEFDRAIKNKQQARTALHAALVEALNHPEQRLDMVAQPVREPLTVQEVEQILHQHDYELHGDRARYIVRMTEQAHGIGSEK